MLDGTWKAKNSLNPFSVFLKGKMQNQTISELCTDDKKTKYSNNTQDILKFANKFYEDLYSRGKISRDAINKLLNKVPNSRRYLWITLASAKEKFP